MKLSHKILDVSDQGREIILSYYPQAAKSFTDYPKKTPFKMRTGESTASAYVKQNKDGVWIVTDFGGDGKAKNCFGVVMKEKGIDFVEALTLLAKQYNLTSTPPKSKVDYKTATPKETPGCTYVYNESFTETELDILGPEVDEAICERYKLKSCKSFTLITEDLKKIIVNSTSDYPIFVFDHTTWQKRYEPLNVDKSKRFRHSGDKPQNFVNGLDQLKDAQEEHEETVLANWEEFDKPKPKDLKLDGVIIASGDRDALNVAAFGYNVVWLNSESDTLTYEDYNTLKDLANNIYVLYDIDKAGRKQAVELALEFTDIKIIWLPKWLSFRKDFRGKPRKDFRDLVQVSYHQGNESIFKGLIKKMISNALPMRFWDENWVKNKKTGDWYCKYDFNNAYAMHFIEHQGFYLYEDEQSKEDYDFIKIDGNVVQRVKGHHIKKHLLNYLERKNHSVDLRNMLLKTNQLSDKSLSQLNAMHPQFKKGYVNSQYLFFKNCTWYITDKTIKSHKLGEVKNFVWKNDILDFEPKIESDYFKITKDQTKGYDIEILNSNVKYLNYLTNTARVYWKNDLEVPFTTDGVLDKAAQLEYHQNNRFNIASDKLTETQIWEQKQHLVNKIFSIGYLLHSFKDQRKSWFVWNMDYEIVDDIESNGGTGKSLFFKMLFPILKNIKKIDGRERNIADKDFLFDGVTDRTDLMLIEDMDAYFRAHRFLNPITDDMMVNPKGHTPYVILHQDSPKLAGTSNFGVGNMDGALRRRLLFTATGDYYHEQGTKYNESRQVSDDFNGKRLINDFTDQDWNEYYNFCAQCIKFYLSQPKRINPPLDNVEKRNNVRDMGSKFKSWADSYFDAEINLDIEVEKQIALDDYKKAEGLPKFSSQAFKTKLKAWCDNNDFVFNPSEYMNRQDPPRITRKVNNKATEFFYIQTPATQINDAVDANFYDKEEDNDDDTKYSFNG